MKIKGNDAVLKYPSRYVFRTAISNARIRGMDQTHVAFRWKHRDWFLRCWTLAPRFPVNFFLQRNRPQEHLVLQAVFH